jgi:hypothetical protein
MLGIGEPVRDLPTAFTGPLPSAVGDVRVFCPGCLVLEAHVSKDFDQILAHPAFAKWPLLVLVDSVQKTVKSVENFLWTVFTRFEPAADIHAASNEVVRHHLCYRGPILIDARMKPSYPKEVLCDDETAQRVTQRWNALFPYGMAMGDSLAAHVC